MGLIYSSVFLKNSEDYLGFRGFFFAPVVPELLYLSSKLQKCMLIDFFFSKYCISKFFQRYHSML